MKSTKVLKKYAMSLQTYVGLLNKYEPFALLDLSFFYNA